MLIEIAGPPHHIPHETGNIDRHNHALYVSMKVLYVEDTIVKKNNQQDLLKSTWNPAMYLSLHALNKNGNSEYIISTLRVNHCIPQDARILTNIRKFSFCVYVY